MTLTHIAHDGEQNQRTEGGVVKIPSRKAAIRVAGATYHARRSLAFLLVGNAMMFVLIVFTPKDRIDKFRRFLCASGYEITAFYFVLLFMFLICNS